jgi:hypothetical protein
MTASAKPGAICRAWMVGYPRHSAWGGRAPLAFPSLTSCRADGVLVWQSACTTPRRPGPTVTRKGGNDEDARTMGRRSAPGDG